VQASTVRVRDWGAASPSGVDKGCLCTLTVCSERSSTTAENRWGIPATSDLYGIAHEASTLRKRGRGWGKSARLYGQGAFFQFWSRNS